MTEEAKIARLWTGFRRLSEQDKTLVLKFAGFIPRKVKPGKGREPEKNPKPGTDEKSLPGLEEDL
ncbi:MAG: hypothetical protein LBK66_01555 [Spirochaetaceae bacterium]|jgi:hypothetical protein|nr:hypothetical protein [Spirochaetaceae bacterium]